MASEDAGPRLPTELVHDIVSSVVACYIDDLIMGPLSLFANRNVAEDLEEDLVLASPSPVLALLAVSNQLRQVTLEILSDALAIPLRNDAVCVEFWRLECKPWPVLRAVRKASLKADGTLERDEAEAIGECIKSNVLAAYILLRTIMVQLNTFTSLVTSPGVLSARDHQNQRINEEILNKNIHYWGYYSRRCPAAFEDAMLPAWRKCANQVFLMHGYDTFLGEIRAQWAAIGPFFADMSGFMALYFGNHVNARISEITGWVRQVRLNDANLSTLDCFPKPLIGVARLSSWCNILQEMIGIRGHDDLLKDLKEAAAPLLEIFSRRLEQLNDGTV